MTTVVLAEKPDQARCYMSALGIPYKGKAHIASGQTFLDNATTVCSAAGHLFELCEPEHYDAKYEDREDLSNLPIFPEHFDYELRKEVKNFYFDAKKAIEQADTVIVATDNDSEGCAIARNILIRCKGMKYRKVLRAYPSALNKSAVIHCFKNLKTIDQTWRDATSATARAKSDWLIGMNLSRLYNSKLKMIGISGHFAVGRSISTTLKLICQWYREIRDFVEQPIYSLKGSLFLNEYKVELTSKIKVVGEKGMNALDKYNQLKQVHRVAASSAIGKVVKVDSAIKQTYPQVLLTKGDLYKEMARTHGWSRSRSERIMQKNYEEGYMTYPRTDSGLITKYQYSYLYKNFKRYCNLINFPVNSDPFVMPKEKLKKYLTSEDDADAHLAIIPTEKLMDTNSKVTEDQRTMYEVVCRNSLKILLPPYKYVSNSLVIQVHDVLFGARNTSELDLGWKSIIPPTKKKRKRKKKDKSTPGLDYRNFVGLGQQVKIDLKDEQSATRPLKPLKSIQIYDKGGLMENAYKYVNNPKYAAILRKAKGLGTSATRDKAMESLILKGYVTVDNKDIVTVTPNGYLMNYLMKDSIVNNPILTAMWERFYEAISVGKADGNKLVLATEKVVLREIKSEQRTWNPAQIKVVYEKLQKIYAEESHALNCPLCKHPITKIDGKWKRYVCTNPDCKFVLFAKMAKKTLPQKAIKSLLELKTTDEIKGFKKKDGTKFSAKVRLDPSDNLKPKFVYGN